MPPTPPRHPACPSCEQPLRRVRRLNIDRAQNVAHGARRYSCTDAACGWQGLLVPQRQPDPAPAVPLTASPAVAAKPRPAWWPGWLAAFAGVAAAAGVPALLVVLMSLGVLADRHAQRSTPLGESHDGRALPARHPLQRVVHTTAPVADGEVAPTPLAVREHCAWGQPGRNPYQGSTEQALRQARLPPEVVTQIAQMRQAGTVTDRLEVRTGAIRALADGRHFNPRSFAMTFGRTLCLNARVNFAPGHVEMANLYEASDARGKRHSVMVPDVCGNVSVLGARGERVGKKALTAALAAQGGPAPWLTAMPADDEAALQENGFTGWVLALRRALDDEADLPGHQVALGLLGVRAVPEPGTLACVLAALGVMVVVRRCPSASQSSARLAG